MVRAPANVTRGSCRCPAIKAGGDAVEAQEIAGVDSGVVNLDAAEDGSLSDEDGALILGQFQRSIQNAPVVRREEQDD